MRQMRPSGIDPTGVLSLLRNAPKLLAVQPFTYQPALSMTSMRISVPILLAGAGGILETHGVLSHFVFGPSLKINTVTSAMVP
jgi:hypothetical protein